MRTLLLAGLFAFTVPAVAAEDFRVMRLEQDMRTLEREVQSLQRLVNELQQRARRTDPTFELKSDSAAEPAEADTAWLKAATWNRVKPGMSELEVIEILGKPTALRPDANDRKTLLYTLEIGPTNFLAGSIAFDSGKVVEIQKPALK